MLGMSTRALSFGSAAQAYERFRPGYPDALAEVVLAYAGGPLSTALEIGAGTGKATRLFVAHGVSVTATEPDAAMLAELRRTVPGISRVVHAAFEDLEPDESYSLVYAAAALHWTRPEGRWERVAALLAPGGMFASFGGPVQLADPAVVEAEDAARAPFLADDGVPSPDGTDASEAMQWPGTELRRSELFCDVRQSVLERRWTATAEDYVGYLSTVSAYLELPEARRRAALLAVAAALPDTVEIEADIVVHLARSVPAPPAQRDARGDVVDGRPAG